MYKKKNRNRNKNEALDTFFILLEIKNNFEFTYD